MKQFNNLREEALLEKLKASDPTGKWISDFVHSDNPKFAGKSKKERIRMALGASYGAKRNEEVEQQDEGVMDTVKSVVKKGLEKVGGGTDQDQLKRLQKNMGVPQTGKKPEVKEEAEICPVCETDPCICEQGQHIEEAEKPGLYANIHAKRRRIAAGSGERMRKPGSKGAPTAQAFKDAAKTVKEDSEVEEMVAPNAPVHTPISFGALKMKTDKKYAEKLKASQGKSPSVSVKEDSVDESLADMVMGAAKSAGLNAKIAKSSAERKKDTEDMLKKRADADKAAGIKRPMGGLYSKEYHPKAN